MNYTLLQAIRHMGARAGRGWRVDISESVVKQMVDGRLANLTGADALLTLTTDGWEIYNALNKGQ